jgi:YD repeat-containing protein
MARICFGNTYDAGTRLVALVNPQGHRTTQAYDAADRLTVRVAGNGSRTTFQYDNAGQQLVVANTLAGVVVANTRAYALNLTRISVSVENLK